MGGQGFEKISRSDGVGYQYATDITIGFGIELNQAVPRRVCWSDGGHRTDMGSYRVVKHSEVITFDPDRRFGKPCIRDTRITVFDVFEYLAGGMTHEQLLEDFPR